ncbi:Pkinase-domain-containing protein [Rozella allomycis CSF55]|uniref:non-specific serine/threonine protein kinase n=1 Tax=Rozella allomycis (strain CSF55) TaxID=988480 RepID=A0A075B112_ROZAC|nr:Protein kinase, catalytic domain-containing protein [Rozella allomycis CSF55]RKP20796.1 Pkinase-domain-containing protein [Rozella allomycis CSF55]|eukprot:EPZ34621.1 Protein kinase, catalytic domain-containing protein [Rozella allomycis CSF55]
MSSQVHPAKVANKQSREQPKPEVVGNYRLDKIVGKGTYGTVHAAYRLDNNEKVAIKVINKSSISAEKHVTRIQREIRFLKLLHHPHIIAVLDVIENEHKIFIVMEYAQKGELFDYIVANKRLKDKEARFFFRQIISAVDYCHRNSIIHRDLKPENLLLDENKNIKIIDFGFCNTFRLNGQLDTFCGSPFYASPEMVLGKRYLGPEVDVWSLGVILYALLCGVLPFEDENVKILYKKIATASYYTPEYLSAESKNLIARMLVADPSKRATLDEIKKHVWMMDGYDSILDNYLPERPILSANRLNNEIVRRMVVFGCTADEVTRAFEDAKSNPIKNIYYLLSEKLQRAEKEKKMREEKAHRDSTTSLGSSITSLANTTSTISAMSLNSNQELASQNSLTESMQNNSKKGHERRFSAPIQELKSTTPAPKELNGWFLNVSTTTSKTPDEIIEIIRLVLKENSIGYQHSGFVFYCEEICNESDEKINFEIEICKVAKSSMHGLHFRRVNGGLWAFKKLCTKLVQQLHL